jgi:transcriptional regulator with XRE-family HTH domain
MKTIDALKFWRKKKKIPQSEMLPGKNEKRYHRIESGLANLEYEDLLTSLNTLELSFKEFFSLIDMEHNIPIMAIEKQFQKCQTMLNNEEEKKKLLSYFYYLDKIEEKNSMETALYNDIKVVYHPIWPEIPQINSNDIEHVLSVIKSKEYYSYYDYRIAANPIIFFPEEQTEEILRLMYPINDQEHRDFATIKVANLIYINIITGQLYKNNLDKAAYYIQQAKSANITYKDYHFHFNLDYLESLTNYLITKGTQYYINMLNTIATLERYGNKALAEGMKNESTNLINGKHFDLTQGIIPNNVVVSQS